MNREDDALKRLAESLARRLAHRFEGESKPSVSEGVLRDTLDAVADRYRGHGLAYHNAEHLRDCLITFDRVRQLAEDHDGVEAALWYHDAIYNPRTSDNEASSAGLATRDLIAVGLPAAWVKNVAELVLATHHMVTIDAPDADVIRDVDLAILGRPEGAYRRYADAIRREYRHVEELAYVAGRWKILNAFLKRPRVYATDWFHDRFEAAARKNMNAELRRLTAA